METISWTPPPRRDENITRRAFRARMMRFDEWMDRSVARVRDGRDGVTTDDERVARRRCRRRVRRATIRAEVVARARCEASIDRARAVVGGGFERAREEADDDDDDGCARWGDDDVGDEGEDGGRAREESVRAGAGVTSERCRGEIGPARRLAATERLGGAAAPKTEEEWDALTEWLSLCAMAPLTSDVSSDLEELRQRDGG